MNSRASDARNSRALSAPSGERTPIPPRTDALLVPTLRPTTDILRSSAAKVVSSVGNVSGVVSRPPVNRAGARPGYEAGNVCCNRRYARGRLVASPGREVRPANRVAARTGELPLYRSDANVVTTPAQLFGASPKAGGLLSRRACRNQRARISQEGPADRPESRCSGGSHS